MLARDESFLILYERMKEQGDRFDASLVGLDALLEAARTQQFREGINDVFKTVQIAAYKDMESENDEEE